MIKGIISLLVGDATVNGLVGTSNSTTKIFPVVAEQEVKRPYVTVRRTSQQPTLVKSQASELDQVFVNIAVYADTYEKCIDIQNAIRTVLDDYSGTESGVIYKRVWYQNSQDLFDQDDKTFVVVDTYSARVQRVL